MDKFNILIVEDELLVAEDIRLHLIDLGYNVTGMACSYNEAITSIMDSLPDLVLLDINIAGDKNGIELGKFLNAEVDIPFIYLTGQGDKNTIKEANETKPGAYLLKPFTSHGLYAAIETALSNANVAGSFGDENEEIGEELILKDSLFIKKGNGYIKLKIESIKYIISEGNYLNIYKSAEEFYLIRSSMVRILPHLPNEIFFQTHKSHLVNLNFLHEVQPNQVIVEGKEIPLSKQRRELLFNRLKTFS